MAEEFEGYNQKKKKWFISTEISYISNYINRNMFGIVDEKKEKVPILPTVKLFKKDGKYNTIHLKAHMM